MKNGLLARQRPRGKTRTKLLPSEMNSNCVSQKSSWSDVVSKKKSQTTLSPSNMLMKYYYPRCGTGANNFHKKRKRKITQRKNLNDGELMERCNVGDMTVGRNNQNISKMSFCQQSIWFIMHVLLIEFPPYAIRQEVQLCQCFSHTLHQVTLTECCWVIHNW